MFGFGKGKIKIELEKFNYSPGETVKGKLILNLKKPIEARGLYVEFIGEQRTSQNIGVKRSSQTRRVYDFKQTLDGEKEYPAGQELVYPFEIKIPENTKHELNEKVEKALAIAKTIGLMSNYTSWFIIGKLDVPLSIDISKKIQITVC